MTMIGLAISPCAVRAGTLTPTLSATTPALAALTHGDPLSGAVTWGEVTPIDGVTITETRQMRLSSGGEWAAYDGDHVAEVGETISVRQVWEAEGYATRTLASATQVVTGIAPEVTASAEMDGRTLTISVYNLTGVPAPTVSIAMTLDAVAVTPSGSGPWVYTVPDSTASQTVAWTVTATNSAGSDTADGSVPVPASLFAPINTVAPAIVGTPAVDSVLTCSTGTWTGTPTFAYAFQWRRDGVSVAGAASASHTLAAADEGTTISCTVTATNAVGSATATSPGVVVETAATVTMSDTAGGTVEIETNGDGAATLTVSGSGVAVYNGAHTFSLADLDGGPVVLVAPGIETNGSGGVGDTLSMTWPALIAHTGSMQRAYQWQRDGSDISGATDETGLVTIAAGDHSLNEDVTDDNGTRTAKSAGIGIATGSLSPAGLFGATDNGFWYDFSDASTLWQDTDGATAVTASGQTIRRADDKSGKGNAATNAGAVAAWDDEGFADFTGLGTLVSAFSNNATTATLVIAYTTTGAGQEVLAGSAASTPRWYMQARNTPAVRFGIGNTASDHAIASHGAGHVLVMAYDASATQRYRRLGRIDGVDKLDDMTTDTIPTGALQIGGAPGFKGTCEIWQALAIDRALSKAEIADLEAWFADKLGISL